MGEEKLDNAVYYIRGLYDLADMARSKHDTATAHVGPGPRRPDPREVRHHLVGRRRRPVRRLARNPDQQVFQKHWIGVTPMEVQFPDGSTLAPAAHAATALGRPRERLLQRHARR